MCFSQLFKTSLRAVSNDSSSRFYNKLLLTLVSPTQTFYCRQPILSITVPGNQGAFTLTNHHSQIISQLKPGLVTVREGENTVEHFFITNGFASLTAYVIV
jgi:F-type H+-transporting ATPase subunit delta